MTETPLSATLGLLAFGVLVLLIAAVIANVRWPHEHPARQDGQRKPPARRGTNPCSVANCGKPATTILRAGFTNWPVCGRCREELEALRGEAS